MDLFKIDDVAVEAMDRSSKEYVSEHLNEIKSKVGQLSDQELFTYFDDMILNFIGYGYEVGLKTATKAAQEAVETILNR